MDSDSPTSRVERTFWTVWNYISEAVSRFLRSEPTNITSNDPNSTQKSAVDSELANVGHAEGDTNRRGVDEEQSLATASLLSSSRPLVAWELCTTDIDLGSNEESMQCKTQTSRGSESKASVEGEGMREEQFAQVGHDDDDVAVLLVAKENEDQNLSTGGQDEMPENAMCEEHANARSLRLTGDAMSEDVEESRREAGAEEETERAVSPEDPQKMAETIQEKEADDQMQHEDLQVEDTEVKLCMITDVSLEEEVDSMHLKEADTEVIHEEVENRDGVPQLTSENENESDKGAKQVENQLSECEKLLDDDRDIKGFPSSHVELQMAQMSEDDQIVVEQEHATAHRSESDKVEDAKEEEDEREHGAVEENVSKAANNQTRDEAPEQEDDNKTVTEDSQEEDILTVACSREVVQNAKAEMHTADGEQEDMAEDSDVQTKMRAMDHDETASHDMVIDEKSDVTTTHISVDERLFDKNQGEEEKLSNKESYMETACTTTSDTLRPQGETGQEMSGEFKNIPLGVCEGRAAVSQELNFPTCKETQEGVPGYNNEPGPDENTTQRFLEDCEEIQGSQLPEEVESKEQESLQNSGSGADYLLVREPMEEDQEGTQDITDISDAGLPQEMEKPLVEAVIQETVFEERELLIDSMKTGIEHSEEEYESDVELRKELDKLTKEPRDGTEELLVEFEIDKGLCDAAEDGNEMMGAVTAQEDVGFADEKFLEAEAQKMTETSFFQETVDAINSVQNSNTTACLVEDLTETGFPKQSNETEPELLEDVEMRDAGIDVEEAAEDEMQSKNELLHLAESESSEPVESLETKYQRSDEALEMSNEEMLTDTEATHESKTTESELKDLILISTEVAEGSYAEKTVHGRQDVIDEEILDLWLQTALSEDGVKQQEVSEPGQQMEPSSEEQNYVLSVQTERDKDQLEQLNSTELVGDTDVSSSTVESGFSDQSLSEWGVQNNETQLLRSTTTESFQDIYDTLANVPESADIYETSTQQPYSKSLDILREKAAETGQSYLKEEESITGVTSPEAGHLDQELDKSREETDEERTESVVTETVFQKEIDAEVTDWKNAEETDAKSLTGMKVEKTSSEDEPLEITVSESPDEVKHTESGRSRSSSEAPLEEEMVSRSISQDNTYTESKTKSPSVDKPPYVWSEDVSETLPEVNKDEVAEQPMTTSEDQMEVLWKEADAESLTGMSTPLKVEETISEDEALEIIVSEYPDEVKHTESGQSRSGSEASLEEEMMSESVTKSPSVDKPPHVWSEDVSESLPEVNKDEVAEQPTTTSEDQMEVLWKEAKEADAKSLTGTSAPLKVEETISEDEPLEITVSDSPESGRSRSSSEASLKEEMVSGSGSQVDTYTESERKSPSVDKPPCVWSEDVSQSLPEVNEDEVAVPEHSMATSDDQMEELWKNAKEADAKSLAGMSAPLKVEKTSIEDELLEKNVSESPDEAKHTESGRSRSGSEASLKEEMVSGSGSQGDTYTESERKSPSVDISQPVWSEGVSESLPEVNEDEVAEQPTTTSEDQMEVLWKEAKEADAKSLTGMNTPLKVEETISEDEPLEITVSDSPESGRSRSSSEASLKEEMVSGSGSQGDTYTESERKSPSVDKPPCVWSEGVSESLPEVNEDEVAEQPMTTSEEQMEVDISLLDLTAQRSRIAVKNPRVRPPKDPRSLLLMPSLDPSPRLSAAKGPAGVPLGGLGIGIKLPGLGAGFPVLRKTQQVVREENSPDAISQETKPEEKSDTPNQDETPHRPKWMPPRHPGFGNPLMSELKTKLKKTTKE